MSRAIRALKESTLESFLKRPEIDEQPYLEFIDGRIEAKVSPSFRHNVIAQDLVVVLNRFAAPRRLGLAVVELRCTFGGRSIVPDVVFLLKEHIVFDDRGELVDEVSQPPDLMIEILSPGQTLKKSREKIAFSMERGVPLGWLIDPKRKIVEIFRPDRPVARLGDEDALEGEPILPGFRVGVVELFGWLKNPWDV